MRKEGIKKAIGVLLCLLFIMLSNSAFVKNVKKVPEELQIFEGEVKVLDFGLPFQMEIEGDNVNVLKFNGNSLKDQQIYNMSQPLKIQTVDRGDVLLNFKLFGFIPIKQMKIKVYPPKKIYPGGNSIGVSLYTRGALLVGIAEVYDENGDVHCPALEAGLRPGDIIEKVNGIPVKNAEHLSELVNVVRSQGLDLEIRRGHVFFTTHIIPVQDMHDGKYRLGIWVRDSTAGVGTLTFYDPEKGTFGALGHAITDVDTGTLLSVKDGEIMQSQIIDVKHGTKGNPGELKGVFSEKQKVIGNILKNTRYGIYGKVKKSFDTSILRGPMPISHQHDVKLGKAYILTTVDEEGIKEFEIEILKINTQSRPSAKGMVIRITDPQLLKRTGGIVQGMSGSPIIQNGKIVGAVTHVFVNDPQKGYGIFIEWMLDEANKIIDIES